MNPRELLLVEDNADDEALTLRAFEKNRIRNSIAVVRDGEEALEYLFHSGRYEHLGSEDLPAIVLLDLKLPKVSGLEVLRQIRSVAETRLLPVIILTSSQEERDLLEGYSSGANSYIVKPVDNAQFSECIRQLGLYWLILNQPVPKEKAM